jgi:GNAT superfamily N-acetyltransferase
LRIVNLSPNLRLASITALHPDVVALHAEAIAEGFAFLDRLIDDWTSGSNRFARPGEVLLGAFLNDDLVGVGALNRDPYTCEEGVGRLRRIYVTRSARRHGVGAALVRRLLEEARGVFRVVRLRAAGPEAAALYLRFGFVAVEDDTATHVITLVA